MAKKKAAAKRDAVPQKPEPKAPTMAVSVTVPKELLKELDLLCKDTRMNCSEAITEAIRSLLSGVNA